jgi:hypothetical protein
MLAVKSTPGLSGIYIPNHKTPFEPSLSSEGAEDLGRLVLGIQKKCIFYGLV